MILVSHCQLALRLTRCKDVLVFSLTSAGSLTSFRVSNSTLRFSVITELIFNFCTEIKCFQFFFCFSFCLCCLSSFNIFWYSFLNCMKKVSALETLWHRQSRWLGFNILSDDGNPQSGNWWRFLETWKITKGWYKNFFQIQNNLPTVEYYNSQVAKIACALTATPHQM